MTILTVTQYSNDIVTVVENQFIVNIADFDTGYGLVPLSTVDAKGSLIVGIDADQVGELAVGDDNDILIASSGQTTGLDWTPFTTFRATLAQVNTGTNSLLFVTPYALDNSKWGEALLGGWVVDSGWTIDATTDNKFACGNLYLKKGDRIKCSQTTVKYFYVTSATIVGTVNTVTVTGGSDYTLTHAVAITSPYYSKAVLPVDFPEQFTWTGHAVQGYSGSPTDSFTFIVIGSTCFCKVRTTGTSSGTTLTGTLPVQPISINHLPINVVNDGTYSWGKAVTSGSDATVTYYTSAGTGAWSSTKTIGINYARFNYTF